MKAQPELLRIFDERREAARHTLTGARCVLRLVGKIREGEIGATAALRALARDAGNADAEEALLAELELVASTARAAAALYLRLRRRT